MTTITTEDGTEIYYKDATLVGRSTGGSESLATSDATGRSGSPKRSSSPPCHQ